MHYQDVTVRGAGVFGLSIAFCCARKGARVRVIDPFGVGAGSSGGIVGALAPHTPESWNDKKAFQFDSLMAAEPFWSEVAHLSGLNPGYARLGRLQTIADARALALAEARSISAEQLWQGRAQWTVVPDSAFAGWAPPSPSGFLIHDTLSARLHPRRACEALATAVLALGGTIDTGSDDAGPDRGAVIWATGYRGLLDISADLGKSVGNGVKGQAILLAGDAGPVPQIFADGLHVVPHDDGAIAVGSTSEREFSDPSRTDDQLDGVLDRARAICPALRAAPVLARWAGVRPRARSRAPMLGSHPTRPGAFLANGGFKIGFGIAPAVGMIMADLVLDGQDRIPDAFRVEASL
ncbi:FAD-binding oxidoreductase [Pseudoruegeria sp. SK021]|uniref:NAD(P)/FAD-dependent oxidoreductase n=1 Tax=Pseudoruegeria sp. SK021 TaxID=1933035 RepID=UPI000A2575C0|nr:FAD-binding oxidoreductase [Pseudoruegeria sp. SK021]OSP53734.1 oxidoreductase [Pseudoruegeria sp. SK021]